MHRMNKKTFTYTYICLLLALVILLVFHTPASICHAATIPSVSEVSNTFSPKQFRAANIGWQYRQVNRMIFKRLYNYETQEWIGDWILVTIIEG